MLVREPRRPPISPEFSNARTRDEDGGGRVNPNPSSPFRLGSRHSLQLVPQSVAFVFSGATSFGDVSFNSDHLLAVAQPPHTTPHRPCQKETRDFDYGLFPLRPIMSSLLALSGVWPNKVFLQKSRSDQNPSLSIFSKRWCRFMEPVVHG
ncbi:hypothetical protein ISN44_As09g005010 [Arabidopsis suecica]|uniref:Uncharacterized protein n=1 Tax=Arabidopsis suecica TaxID=45249 RepID=A0A8T2ACW5_ARASU|nr:hypothetical protein ISN44_As09g005010 [Arabidopsis suecica]